jgi:ariadne-1
VAPAHPAPRSTGTTSLKKCNSTEIFEDNQANLEQAVEDLSEMLEKPIDATTIMQLKSDMVNKTNYVEKRAGIILSDTLQGHYEVSRASRDRMTVLNEV